MTDIEKRVREAYDDIATTGAKHPVVVIVRGDDATGRLIAERHVINLLAAMGAKTLEADGTLKPIPKQTTLKRDEIDVQSWPLDLLLDAMRSLGCPQPLLDKYRHQLSKVPAGHDCWMLSFIGQPAPMAAPLPKKNECKHQ